MYQSSTSRPEPGNIKETEMWEQTYTCVPSSSPSPILTSLSWAYFPCRFFHIILPFPGYSLCLLVFLTALFSVCSKPMSPELESNGNLVELAASAYLLFRRSVGGLHVSDFIKWFLFQGEKYEMESWGNQSGSVYGASSQGARDSRSHFTISEPIS